MNSLIPRHRTQSSPWPPVLLLAGVVLLLTWFLPGALEAKGGRGDGPPPGHAGRGDGPPPGHAGRGDAPPPGHGSPGNAPREDGHRNQRGRGHQIGRGRGHAGDGGHAGGDGGQAGGDAGEPAPPVTRPPQSPAPQSPAPQEPQPQPQEPQPSPSRPQVEQPPSTPQAAVPPVSFGVPEAPAAVPRAPVAVQPHLDPAPRGRRRRGGPPAGRPQRERAEGRGVLPGAAPEAGTIRAPAAQGPLQELSSISQLATAPTDSVARDGGRRGARGGEADPAEADGGQATGPAPARGRDPAAGLALSRPTSGDHLVGVDPVILAVFGVGCIAGALLLAPRRRRSSR